MNNEMNNEKICKVTVFKRTVATLFLSQKLQLVVKFRYCIKVLTICNCPKFEVAHLGYSYPTFVDLKKKY